MVIIVIGKDGSFYCACYMNAVQLPAIKTVVKLKKLMEKLKKLVVKKLKNKVVVC